MAKKNKFIKGAVYRKKVIYTNSGELTGEYMDILCDSEFGTGTVIKCYPEKLKDNCIYLGGEWKIGFKTNIEPHQSIVALSLEEYEYKLPIVEKIVLKEIVKEVVIEKEVVINIDKYEDTFIDRLYNWYCNIKKRKFSDFV